jgi:hypothetical protein
MRAKVEREEEKTRYFKTEFEIMKGERDDLLKEKHDLEIQILRMSSNQGSLMEMKFEAFLRENNKMIKGMENTLESFERKKENSNQKDQSLQASLLNKMNILSEKMNLLVQENEDLKERLNLSTRNNENVLMRLSIEQEEIERRSVFDREPLMDLQTQHVMRLVEDLVELIHNLLAFSKQP